MLIKDKIKNFFRSDEYKMEQLIKVKDRKINFKDIKYLKLKGYSGGWGQYPDESYIFISRFADRNRSNPSVELINKGIWVSGTVRAYCLIVKEGSCFIEETIKPN